MRKQALVKTLAGAAVLLLSGSVLASETTGSSLPYEDWLHTLQQSLTGPVAFSVAMIGIVSCGATLIFAGGEIGRFMRTLIYIVMVMTMLIGANSLMTRFFNGASIGDPEAIVPAQECQPRAEPWEDSGRAQDTLASLDEMRDLPLSLTHKAAAGAYLEVPGTPRLQQALSLRLRQAAV